MPTNQDILHCRIKITGIVEAIFYLDPLTYRAGSNLEDVNIDRLREIGCYQSI
ncbi:hypothetical protein C2G38_2207355 [Gigaspora rosea]|uniref:Uncharacterized protein n=1 Tax=Gigaspora rosea TaxID=44941 RepID=A0A397UKH2_9GLOM|nr:hypothetical protein C2G38_2207355 [Gigaspora rosea]